MCSSDIWALLWFMHSAAVIKQWNNALPRSNFETVFSTPFFWVKSQFKDKENLITNINWRTLSSSFYGFFSWAEFEFSILQLNWLQHCSHSKTSKWIACSSILYIGSISWQEAFKHIAVCRSNIFNNLDYFQFKIPHRIF